MVTPIHPTEIERFRLIHFAAPGDRRIPAADAGLFAREEFVEVQQHLTQNKQSPVIAICLPNLCVTICFAG